MKLLRLLLLPLAALGLALFAAPVLAAGFSATPLVTMASPATIPILFNALAVAFLLTVVLSSVVTGIRSPATFGLGWRSRFVQRTPSRINRHRPSG